MDIESKRFKIKTAIGGGFTITNKQTNETNYVSSAPSSHELAMMKERDFDKAMEKLFNE